MDTEYLKKVGLYILTVLLSVGTLFYLGYHVWRSVTREVETAPVTEITAEDTATCDAYIFRSEAPLYQTAGGQSILPTVREGEKVQVGDEVARVYSGNSPQTVAQIADIDNRISLLESCGSGGTVSLKESSKIESDIYTVMSEIREASDNGDAATAQGLRTSLLTLLNKRSLLTGGTVNFTSEIEELKAKKQTLGNSLEACLETVRATAGGYYYSDTDGYETVFKASELSDISYESLAQVLSSSPQSTENCAGKTVTDSYWYAVCPLDRKYLETYKAGDDCTVRFSGDLSLTMEVYRILSGNGGIMLILRTNYLPEGFSFARMQKVQLVTDICRGYKVPITAVRVVNGETGVYILDGVTVRFCRINTVLKKDTYYIAAPEPEQSDEEETEETEETDSVRWLRFHDNLITEGKGLYDGRVVG